MEKVPESLLMRASTSHSQDIPEQQTLQGQMVDKFMEKIISMALPVNTGGVGGTGEGGTGDPQLDSILLDRIEMQKTRPALSIPIMSRNAILLLQRLSYPFETIDDIIRVINWVDPLWNLTLGMIITLVILKPINLITMPIGYICFKVIIPAYLAKVEGRFQDIKPISEFSREFLLNLTDLQNHMLLYVDTWDAIVKGLSKTVVFQDEQLTWLIFVVLLVTAILLETFGTIIIWIFMPFLKLSLVISLWITLISLHPKLRLKLLSRIHDEELRLRTLSLMNNLDDKISKDVDINLKKEQIKQHSMTMSKYQVFEINIYNPQTETWQFVSFCNDAFPINSHMRKNNVPSKGAESLNGVKPPLGYQWINDKVVGADSSTFFIESDLSPSSRKSSSATSRQRLDSKSKMKVWLMKKNQQENHLEGGIIRDGWYLDMDPNIWAKESLMDSVCVIDHDTKWIYDLGEDESQCKIRRRRWVRFATREVLDEDVIEMEEEEEEEESETTDLSDTESQLEAQLMKHFTEDKEDNHEAGEKGQKLSPKSSASAEHSEID